MGDQYKNVEKMDRDNRIMLGYILTALGSGVLVTHNETPSVLVGAGLMLVGWCLLYYE